MSLSKLTKFAIRLTVSGGLIWWVLRQIDADSFLAQLETVSLAAFLFPVLLIMFFGLIQVTRWVLVQGALSQPLSFFLSAKIHFLSLFFNQTLPSTIGGDAIRVTYGYRNGLALNTAVKGVLIDRLSALLALILMSGATLPLLYDAIGNHAFADIVTVIVAIALVGAMALVALRVLPQGPKNWPGLRQAASLSDAIWSILLQPARAGLVTLISLVVHVGLGLIVYYLAWLLGTGVDPLICLTLYPPVILVSMAPISIAGWGVRESAMVAAFTLVGMNQADALAISVLFGAIAVASGLLGALIWLVAERWGPAPDHQHH